jgi:hypothetical protein
MRSSRRTVSHAIVVSLFLSSAVLLLSAASSPAFAQTAAVRDPAEPQQKVVKPKILPRPAGAVTRAAIDEKSMRALIDQLVACGTRLSIASWSDANRGPGCGRDRIVARLNEIAKASGGKLQVVVDKFEATSARTSNKPAPMENVYAILPGTDEKLSKTVFIVSGHLDSRPSDDQDTKADAPGADDDASGVAVSVESARLLSKAGADGQGGYRVRVFSGNGEIDDCDSSSRELARAVEEIDGRAAIRLVFRVDRYGRGGDHYPFYKAGLPAVRFTEPLEDYTHQHQTPRTEGDIQYGDFAKYLNATFLGNVARNNAEALRQLALAPAPPANARLTGAVTPDAKVSWSAEEDSERAGFEILWRETTESRWSIYTFAESAGETVLKGVSTDNHFFAVRSVGKNGARSIAVPTEMERRPIPGTTKK